MRRREKGLLLEKNGNGIVLTPDGDFRFVPSPAAEVGAEITLTGVPAVRWWLLSIAAALTVVFIGLGLYRYFLPTPVAYVALDINPSLELGLDRQERVVRVEALNGDAVRLTAGVKLRGLPVTEAVKALICRAAELGYVSARREGVVLLTVVPVREGEPVPRAADLAQAAGQAVAKRDLQVKVVATAVPAKYREEAHRLGLSPGRYVLKMGASRAGKPVTVQELKREGLARLEAHRRVPVEELVRAGQQDGVVVVPAKIGRWAAVREKEEHGRDEAGAPEGNPVEEKTGAGKAQPGGAGGLRRPSRDGAKPPEGVTGGRLQEEKQGLEERRGAAKLRPEEGVREKVYGPGMSERQVTRKSGRADRGGGSITGKVYRSEGGEVGNGAAVETSRPESCGQRSAGD
ncbi:hypothetical protein EDD75_1855 [Thermodesulfitimonas autotrophica]|uniref:Anti-sigma factor RsgI-like middle domain-containing protein n=1 Tax=Thermodesulfitimonas autotrophica TaxID=1894989 RepID=A0A3N5BAL3_9THEO|nr:anti-sigma factor domain-containing protein [Thermodesulfitimonas autotrophica]RPF42745.1 hypothetical protein EDD75_1855 [Thermodesulfitimonas autotrophica]